MSRAGVAVRVGLAVGAALLAGCQGSAEPPPLEEAGQSESPSPSPSPGASPNEAAPTMPAAAEGTSPEAAEAFVRHWIDVLNYAGPAGDPDAVRALSSQTCVTCSAISQFIEDIASHHGEIVGDGWQIKATSVVTANKKEVVVDATVVVRPQRVRTAEDEAFESFPGGKRLKTFWVSRTGTGWEVKRLDQPS